MLNIEIDGLDEVMEDLGKLEDRMRELEGIEYEELFDEAFMNKYTHFSSIEEFFDQSDFESGEVDAIPQKALDDYVKENTKFKSWQHMIETAMKEYIDM